MLEKTKIPFAGVLVSFGVDGNEIVNKLLDVIKQLLQPILIFVVALSRVLYPPLLVVGIVLWAIGERWLAWRFLSPGILTAVVVELILPALGLV